MVYTHYSLQYFKDPYIAIFETGLLINNILFKRDVNET